MGTFGFSLVVVVVVFLFVRKMRNYSSTTFCYEMLSSAYKYTLEMMLLEKCMTSRKMSHFSCVFLLVVILSFLPHLSKYNARRCKEFLSILFHGWKKNMLYVVVHPVLC